MNEGGLAIYTVFTIFGFVIFLWFKFVSKKPITLAISQKIEAVLFGLVIVAGLLVTFIWS